MERADLQSLRGHAAKNLTDAQRAGFAALAAKCRIDALEMISSAQSGHPGGALSCMDLLLMALLVRTADDRVLVSAGHLSAALYSALGNLGYFDVEEAKAGFRRVGSDFEGHPSRKVPGVEWCSGALGQGVSVGCGMALANRLRGEAGRVFVLTGDGEHEKGQIAEARAFAAHYGLDLVVLADINGLQAMGKTQDEPLSPIADSYRAAGFHVCEIDGHDPAAIYAALGRLGPLLVAARTVMGKGVPGIEGDYSYHGKPLNAGQLEQARKALGRDEPIPELPEPVCVDSAERRKRTPARFPDVFPKRYEGLVAPRVAMGETVSAIAQNASSPVAVLDCDLSASLGLSHLQKSGSAAFIQCGIAESNAASVAGGLADAGVTTFLCGFSSFALGEAVSQHRMNALNGAPVKLILTHAGLDVGEDGKTHQCVDYLPLLAGLWDMKVAVPADANEAAQAVLWAAREPGPACVIAGRSALPTLGEAFSGPFEYGRSRWLRRGKDITLITMGDMVSRALAAAKLLVGEGVEAGVIACSAPFALDEALLEAADTVFVLEDHIRRMGLSSLVAQFFLEHGRQARLCALGVERPGLSGKPEDVLAAAGLDARGITRCVRTVLHQIYPKRDRV